ncbi:MAG TPA: hypothetical protein VGP72_00730 [Planctomycetota bacterium]
MIASTIGGEKVRVCDAVAEETEKRLAAYRREKEKFGKHPMWRRLTGLTFDYEERVTRKARKEGLKRLLRWLKRTANNTRLQHRGAEDTEVTARKQREEKELSLTRSWDIAPEQWVRAEVCGTQLEELCQRLEISSARLTSLTRECCGMTALEVIDGFKVGRARTDTDEHGRARSLFRGLLGSEDVITRVRRVPPARIFRISTSS